MRLNTQEAAQLLKVSPRTLESWRLQDKGPAYTKIGGAVVYHRQAVVDWLAHQTELNDDPLPQPPANIWHDAGLQP